MTTERASSHRKLPRWLLRLARALVVMILLAALGVALAGRWLLWQRPAQTPVARELFQGVRYERQWRHEPRPALTHLVTIDLTAPGIDFVVTPRDPDSSLDTLARTGSQFLREFGAQVVVNASFFDPFSAQSPWNYYPYPGDPVDALGRTMANGERYSEDHPEWATLCLAAGQAVITTNAIPSWATCAVSGRQWLMHEGRVLIPRDAEYPEPEIAQRTAAALDREARTLWLVVIDGRQGGYSEGVTLRELADFLAGLGAWSAVNLDGGGSTTLVVEEAGQPRVLNAVFHTRVPMRERPVATHLGVRALPIP